jgi:GT2 family glycosyltransferase
MDQPIEDLSVCVLHWEQPECLREFLGAFHTALHFAQGQIPPRFTLHIFDDGSAPDTADEIADIISKEKVFWGTALQLHRYAVHRGYSASLNEWMRRSEPSGFVLFVDVDLRVSPDFFSVVPQYQRRSPDKARMSCGLIQERGRNYCSGRLDLSRATGRRLLASDSASRDFAPGDALLVPARLFAMTGGWPERYGGQNSDIELSRRLVVEGGWELEQLQSLIFRREGSRRGVDEVRCFEGRGKMIRSFAKGWARRLALVSWELEGLKLLLKLALRGQRHEARRLQNIAGWKRVQP